VNPDRQTTFVQRMTSEDRVALYKSGAHVPANQYTKAKSLGLPLPKLAPESIAKSIETKIKNNTLNWTEEQRKSQSASMKLAVENHPESYTSSNRGRTKQIEKYGIKFQGSWELTYYEWCLNTGVKIERCDKRFSYEWDGTRTYNPDFYHPDTDIYVEVKGYETEKDRAKWRDFPHELLIIRKKEIEEMRKFLLIQTTKS